MGRWKISQMAVDCSRWATGKVLRCIKISSLPGLTHSRLRPGPRGDEFPSGVGAM